MGRNGKSSSQRSHQALPYVVPSSTNTETTEKDGNANITSPENTTTSSKSDEKKENTSGTSDEVIFSLLMQILIWWIMK